MPIRDAIARIDKPSLLWRYLICAQSCTVITHPIVVGWPIFKERQWPGFQRALTGVVVARKPAADPRGRSLRIRSLRRHEVAIGRRSIDESL
jgi:hypothetical protein